MHKFYTKKYLNISLILGVTSIFIFSINLYLNFLNDFLKGFSMSFGFSLTLISLILLNSPKYMKRMEMSEKDERLVMIKDKQLSTAYSFHIFFSAVLTVIFGLNEETYMISVAIASILLVEGLFLFLIGLYYKNKY